VRFEKFLSQETRLLNRGAKKRLRALTLKIVHVLDGQAEVRRDDVVERLRADVSGYSETEIDSTIKRLHRKGLLYVERGRYSRVYVA
jgi:predicted transcriptional regulator